MDTHEEHEMRSIRAIIFLCIAILSIILITGGDRLPNQTPENQVFAIDTVLEATGLVDESNTLHWVIASPGAIPTGIPGTAQSVADVSYKDSILTNGGKISENKNFGFDSADKSSGLYNLQTEKVLTYASTDGAHLVGEEQYTLDVAGNWARMDNPIRCVFASGNGILIPAFCNIVSAKSNLINLNSGQVSTKGILRATTGSLAPTEMSYRIDVSPDRNSEAGSAEGTVSTVFAGSIMEARDAGAATWNKTAAERTWKDATAVSGGIRTFQKVFGDPSFQSGILGPVTSEDSTYTPTPTPTTPTPTTPTTGTLRVISIDPQNLNLPFPLYRDANYIDVFNTPYENTDAQPGSYWVICHKADSGDLSAGGTLTLYIN